MQKKLIIHFDLLSEPECCTAAKPSMLLRLFQQQQKVVLQLSQRWDPAPCYEVLHLPAKGLNAQDERRGVVVLY